jgi:hypothetical protein
MGAGILSVDLYAIGRPTAAGVVLWFAAGTWLFLAVVLGWRAPGLGRANRLPIELIGVASTCVVGTGFAVHGYYSVAAGLLALAAAGWVSLIAPVLRHWRTPQAGGSFLVDVATQGVVVLSAPLAARNGWSWLLIAAIAGWLLGLCAYGFTLSRFDLRQLMTGRGDQWIAGGALAIATLASAKIVQAMPAVGWTPPAALSDAPLAFWCLAMLWLVPLIVGEALRLRLSYDLRRWSTVFPLGMYAACSFAVGQVTGIHGITMFARAWTWLAVVMGVVVFAGLVRRSFRVLFE